MTNAEKYKTADERVTAFKKFCSTHRGDCDGCEISAECHLNDTTAPFYWLDLEAAEEVLLPCPFCGGTVQVIHDTQAIVEGAKWLVNCYGCQYEYGANNKEKLIAAHNRVARAVKEKEEVEK